MNFMKFELTSHGTIRSTLYAKDDTPVDMEEFTAFNYLSIWGGYDKFYTENEFKVWSWELPITLKDYILGQYTQSKKYEVSL